MKRLLQISSFIFFIQLAPVYSDDQVSSQAIDSSKELFTILNQHRNALETEFNLKGQERVDRLQALENRKMATAALIRFQRLHRTEALSPEQLDAVTNHVSFLLKTAKALSKSNDPCEINAATIRIDGTDFRQFLDFYVNQREDQPATVTTGKQLKKQLDLAVSACRDKNDVLKIETKNIDSFVARVQELIDVDPTAETRDVVNELEGMGVVKPNEIDKETKQLIRDKVQEIRSKKARSGEEKANVARAPDPQKGSRETQPPSLPLKENSTEITKNSKNSENKLKHKLKNERLALALFHGRIDQVLKEEKFQPFKEKFENDRKTILGFLETVDNNIKEDFDKNIEKVNREVKERATFFNYLENTYSPKESFGASFQTYLNALERLKQELQKKKSLTDQKTLIKKVDSQISAVNDMVKSSNEYKAQKNMDKPDVQLGAKEESFKRNLSKEMQTILDVIKK